MSVLPTPLLKEGAWSDNKKDAAKPPVMERTGWSGTRKHFGLPTTPSAALRRLRDIFIDAAATPPVSGLYQEGSSPHPTPLSNRP